MHGYYKGIREKKHKETPAVPQHLLQIHNDECCEILISISQFI